MLFVLVVFSLPGVPVYDGARLFLMVFPLWAIAVGAGVRLLIETPRWRLSLRCALLAIFVAMQGVGLIIYHPCHLSHYNLLVGGLPGALRWGFEATYWGDAVREPMLAEASRRSPGAPILLAPHLAPFQAAAMTLASPALCRSENMLIGYDPSLPEEAKKCRYAVVYRRRADGDIVERLLSEGQVVSEYNVQGEWLARLIEIAPPARRRRQGD